jgi:predicted Zn-dependent protease
MNATQQVRRACLYIGASLLCIATVDCQPAQQQSQDPQPNQAQQQSPTPQPAQAAQPQDQDEEVQMGQEVFNSLKAKGEIIESSPLYDQLRPIADAITRAAQPRYNHPFKFYLVHEEQPNAFATPGGNVYVVDSLLYFVKNREELAGTLCHEVAHTIHRDTVALMEKQQKLKEREVGAAILLGPTRAHVLAILLLGKLHSLSYSRDVESRADITGSDVCAGTGYNPWGLVWLFKDFDNANMGQVPQLLSDHPSNQSRVDALEQHFRKDPSTFGKFSSDPASAAALTVPKNVAEVFMH